MSWRASEGEADLTVRDLIRDNRLDIHYQPVIDLQTQQVLGYEAFVRCDVPAYKSPITLFQRATEQGCPGELGRHLRKAAVRGCPNLPLFLNLVPQELDYGFLVDPADPMYTHEAGVYLEITESVPVQYYELCHDVITRVRAHGLNIAIDDFGSGYSNFLYIADLEPHLVKLDRGLVAGLKVGSRRFRLVQNVARLCLDMGAQVVAEGIETVEELEAVLEAGIHFGQGYLFGRPAPEPPLPVWPLPTQKRVPSDDPVARLGIVVRCIENNQLQPFLDRRRRHTDPQPEPNLNAILSHMLERANAFVPSAAGTIFLDDPAVKGGAREDNELVFVACFGERAADLLGRRLPASKGIVGRVYSTGQPHLSADPEHDRFFYRGIDQKVNYKTESVLCVPLRVEQEVVGAIQLLNRLNGSNYDLRDLGLLEIFAQTISASFVNAVDAQRAVELAKRDDLSGLYNDRYFHYRLHEVVRESAEQGTDCGLLFLDLDNFKGINDTYGHLVGSGVLREVGFIMSRVLPKESVAARYGGDEFVAIFPGTDRATVIAAAEALRKEIEAFVFLKSANPYDPESYPALNITGEITCSVGVATLVHDVLPDVEGSNAALLKTVLLECSDRRMYMAKERGKNRVISLDPA